MPLGDNGDIHVEDCHLLWNLYRNTQLSPVMIWRKFVSLPAVLMNLMILIWSLQCSYIMIFGMI